MRAAKSDDMRCSTLATVKRKTLAHDLDGLGLAGAELLGAMYGMPKPAHKVPGETPWPGGDEIFVAKFFTTPVTFSFGRCHKTFSQVFLKGIRYSFHHATRQACPERSRRERQVTGQGPSSRANARDLRRISPFGRNDNASPLCLDFSCSELIVALLIVLEIVTVPFSAVSPNAQDSLRSAAGSRHLHPRTRSSFRLS
jgi:hypothetical protein